MDRRFVAMLAWQGALLAAATLACFWLALRRHAGEPDGLARAGTVAFAALGLVQIVHAFNARSQGRSALDARLARNPWLWAAAGLCALLQVLAVHWPPLARVLRTVPLDRHDWLLVLAGALAPLLVVEAVKLARRRHT